MALPTKGSESYNYQKAHWDDDIRAQSIAGCIILAITATISVALRLIAQKIYRKGFDASDYLIIVAWMFAMSLVGESIVSIYDGMGLHQLRVITDDHNPPHDIVEAFRAGYFVSVVWCPCLLCTKLSLLFLYRRIFLVQQKWFKIALWANGIYAVAWAIASTTELIFQCAPVDYFWKRFAFMYGIHPPGVKGTCLPQLVHLASPAIISTISDAAILVLPLFVLWGLKMPTKRKIGLIGLFLVGLFVVGVGIARITFIFQVSNHEDVTWNDVETIVWTPVETCIAIFCACVVPTAPLYSALVSRCGIKRRQVTGWVYKPPTQISRKPGHRLSSTDDDLTELQARGITATDNLAVPPTPSDRKNSRKEGVTTKVTAHLRSGAVNNIPDNAIDVERGLEWTSDRVS